MMLHVFKIFTNKHNICAIEINYVICNVSVIDISVQQVTRFLQAQNITIPLKSRRHWHANERAH